ncbi:MAG: EAL domain-containing protein [Methylophilus sp.]|nr:EAL domain-containing protein [Methylophilus sp.]
MPTHFKFVLLLALVSLAYFLTGSLGLRLPYVGSHITLIWLPTGIAVYALMRGGLKFWPSIFLGAFLVNLSIGSSILLALSIAIGNTLGPVFTYWMLRSRLNTSLNHIKDVLLIVSSAAIGMTISATAGVASLFNAGIVTTAGLMSSWLIWWAGDAVGVLMLLPLLLTLTRKEINQLWQARVSYLSASLLVLGFEILIFKFSSSAAGQFSLLAFLVLPMVIWISMRFGLAGSALVVISLSIIAVIATASEQGPFYQANMHQGIISLWAFMSVLTLIAMIINIMQSERLAFEEALQSSETKLRAVINGALDAIVTINEQGKIVEFNPAAEKMFGYQRGEVLDKSLGETIVPPSARAAHYNGHQHFIATGEKKIIGQRVELMAMRVDGTEFPIELTLTSLKEQGIPWVTGFMRDITERKNAEEAINQLAFFEPLTGLPNRRLFLDRLGQAFAHSARENSYSAVLFVDLDNFKSVNDASGHEAGDTLLIEVAKRIKKQLREEDTVSRLGGDEFLILLRDLGSDQEAALLAARQIGEILLHIIAMPYNIVGFEHHTSSSIGICLFSGYEIGQDELLRRADSAMYQAKAKGRNTLCFYDPAMQLIVEHRALIQSYLRNALELNQFSLHYQIQVDANRHIIGAEALLRWSNPEIGMISPVEFIPIAEDTGLIIPIGAWVIESACKQLKSWENTHANHLRLSVNVSVRQFRQPNFVNDVKVALKKTGANPKLLKLELTESLVIDDVMSTVFKMQELKALGVRFAMDDFGTGYSSLIYLKKLPLTQVKIDQSFVRDLVIDVSDAEIVKTIIQMGQALGFNVIAEGVETEAQFDLLRQYGCKEFQGYLFGKPMEINAFNELLKL